VTVEAQERVGPAHANPVVCDPNPTLAPTLDGHLHPGRPGIEGILDQLLDHRGGTFHDLAGSDLVRHDVG
jgi:hypothetical protein